MFVSPISFAQSAMFKGAKNSATNVNFCKKEEHGRPNIIINITGTQQEADLRKKYGNELQHTTDAFDFVSFYIVKENGTKEYVSESISKY